MKNQRIFNLKTMMLIAIFGAISFIVMLFEFPLWFAPPFYQIDFSEVIVLIGGFVLGPIPAIFIELIKIILNLLFNGTITAGIGELANFIMGCAFVLPVIIIYRKKENIKDAIIGTIIGTLSLSLIAAIINYFVLLPAYSIAFKIPIESLVAMGTKINSGIDSISSLVLFAVVPFNLIKGILSSIIVLLVYKKLKYVIKKFI